MTTTFAPTAPAPRVRPRQDGAAARALPEVDRSRRHDRPDLRVAPDARPARGPVRVSVVAGVGMFVLFGLLFAVAVLQTVLVQGQLRLDDLQTQVAEDQIRVQDLRADVAELDAPSRVVDWAVANGFVEPDTIQNVVPPAADGVTPQ